MAKYRKKPVVIDAEPYRQGLEDGFECKTSEEGYCSIKDIQGCLNGGCVYGKTIKPYIDTLEGKHYIGLTDIIITGVKGERYPCKKDIFEMTYEKVDEQ